MIEKKTVVNGLEITYMQKPARYDSKHLVIVFSGFSGDGKPIYNYRNALLECPAEVLWIKDYFHGGETYYLCSQGNLNIEKNIYAFISNILSELGLEKNDCTVLGGSKGGSAALYYGLKYDFGNIIASVPQFHIGSYVEIDWPYAFKHMMGELSKPEINALQKKLDTMITDQIPLSHHNKNIYLISSLADEQYETEINKNIIKLRKFQNFNLLMANSDLINKHNQVNRHTVSITMSIVNLTTMGLAPKFEHEEIKYKKITTPKEPSLIPYVSLKKFKINNGKFYPEGISIIRDLSCLEYSDIELELVLKSKNNIFKMKLAKGNKPELTRELFDGHLVAYDKGWFCTRKYEGVFIDEIPEGDWSPYIKIHSNGVTREAPIASEKDIYSSGIGLNKRMVFSSSSTSSSLSVTKI